MSKGAKPDKFRVGDLPKNFKGVVLVKDLAADVIKAEAGFQAPPTPGTYTLRVHILSTSVIGVDLTCEVSFTVVEDDVPAAAADLAEERRAALVEAVADVDDDVAEAYLEGLDVDGDALAAGIRRATGARDRLFFRLGMFRGIRD